MRVKRYVADSIQEAIARVKNDLGRNAIILHTKPFKEGGFFGFFCHRRFEVIAAVDEDSKPAKSDPRINSEESPNPISTEASNQAAAIRETSPVASATEADFNSLRDEITEMKELIRQVTFKPLIPQVVATPIVQSAGWQDGLKGRMLHLGLTEDLTSFILSRLPETALSNNLDEQLILCQKILEANLMFSEPMKTISGHQSVVALIGPTGVGKTTTIAKLAANLNLFEQKKVGLITIDTYRIAAVEHLKTYGDIMNLSVEVVYAPSDLDQAIQNLHDCDLILIDTAGRSPHNQTMMDELHRFLTHSGISEILLVISATTQYQDMVSIEEKFSRIAYTHLVFTKLDETSCLGPIVSLAWKSKRPISYLTIGQNVPDDIEVAKPEKLIELLFKGKTNG